MPLGVEVGLGPSDIVLHGDPAPLPQNNGHIPQFSAHISCDQMAVCIRIPLGMEVGLSLGDIVLDGDPAPPSQKGTALPIFGQCPLWPQTAGWTKYATWHGGRPRPRRFCVRWGPSFPRKRAQSHPIFGPYLLWPNGWMDQHAILVRR